MTRRGTREAPDLDGLATEAWDASAADLDLRSTEDLVGLMNAGDARVLCTRPDEPRPTRRRLRRSA